MRVRGQVENKVCGTNGLTYMNECEMQIESCRRQQQINVASRGSCGQPPIYYACDST